MNAVRRILALSAVLATTGPASAEPADPTDAIDPAKAAKKTVSAHPLGGAPITIDGVLDEPIWAEAPSATGFVEREPYPGRTPPVRTTFTILYDAERLYVGIVCTIEPGESPRALELQRDNFSIFSDDALSLKFDARLDQRSTVGFVTNPAGAQLDYVVVDNGEFRREFDANWRVATTVEEDRWTAEFEIPIAALGITGDVGSRTIGLNITRDHNHRLATYDWNEMPPEFGPTSALFYGRVTDLDDIAGGRTLTLIPYALAGYTEIDGDVDLELKAGGDLRLRITDDVWSELTLYTDFAQVDLDDPVLNLDRFPLFFPERRPFFLTGLDVFEFGIPGFVSPFFTRRIGLDANADVVPLIGGLKVYGSSGDLRFGVLEVVTGESGEAAAENFTVARARYNLGERGSFGVIATFNGELSERPNGVDNPLDPGFSLGADAVVRALDKRVELATFWTGAFETIDGESIAGQAARAQLSWRGTDLQPSLAVTYIDEDYDPRIGFVARQDLVQSRADLQWVTRTPDGALRNVIVGVSAMTENDAKLTTVLGQQANGFVTVNLESAFRITTSATAKEDFVRSPFEIVPGRTVDVGRYRGPQASLEIASPGGRNPSGSVAYVYDGALFGGTLHSIRASAAVRAGPHFNASVSGNYSVVAFDDFDTTRTFVGSGTVRWVPSTTFGVDVIGQGNALNETAAGLVRVRWRYLPGSELFVIYRENLDFKENGADSGRLAAVKITFRYDAVL